MTVADFIGKVIDTAYNISLKGKRVMMYQYDYRTDDGELFAYCARTLEECRNKRDTWLKGKK